MLMDEVIAKLDRLRRKNAAIRAWRKGHRGEYPVLRPHGRPVLKPKYADKARCILAPGRYRNAICELVRLEHHFQECVDSGDVRWITHRAEEYAWEGIEQCDSAQLKKAQWDVARVVGRDWAPRDLLIRTFKAGTTVAVNATINVKTPEGKLRSTGTYCTSMLRKLDFEEDDVIEVIPHGPPPAAILVAENDASANEVVGLGIAARHNIMVIGVHGIVTREEQCLLSKLASLSLLTDTPMGVLSDLDMGGLHVNKAVRLGSEQDGEFAVPRATRVGLTGEQLDRYCDGCLARAVLKPQLADAGTIVYRSTQPQWKTELDHQTVKDARWLVKRKQAFHLESLQFSPTGDGGKLRMQACLDEIVEQWLQQGL